MHAIPRPAPRVAPATRATTPERGRPTTSEPGRSPAAFPPDRRRATLTTAHLLRSLRIGRAQRANAPRGGGDEARDRGLGQRLARPHRHLARPLPASLEQLLRIRKRESVAEAERH